MIPPIMFEQTWEEFYKGDEEEAHRYFPIEKFKQSLVGPCDTVPLGPEQIDFILRAETEGVKQDPSRMETPAAEDLSSAWISMARMPRHKLAQAFSRGFNGACKIDRDITEPMDYCFDGGPWTYKRGCDTPGLGLTGYQDPWNPGMQMVHQIPVELEQIDGFKITEVARPVDKQNRKKAFKLLLVGPDGSGKTSILFAWKANQALSHSGVEPIPTINDWNVEEFAYKDLLFFVWDQGGPDPLRPFYPPTMRPDQVDAIVFVVDAFLIKHNATYRENAKYELWRHMEGDVYNADVNALRAELLLNLENKSEPVFAQQDTVQASEQFRNRNWSAVPQPLNKDGTPATAPTTAGLWLRPVTRVLILVNKCEMADRASLREIEEILELQKIQTTWWEEEEDGGTPVVIMPWNLKVRRTWHMQGVSAWTGHGLLDGLEWLYDNLEGHPSRSG
mmetsp:Transcript_40044/g.62498  ORF Transcript_40044/g.62498 Transcript_40044/m.62498 type:complete len:447 (-) Transcript_40044:475-1815(-)